MSGKGSQSEVSTGGAVNARAVRKEKLGFPEPPILRYKEQTHKTLIFIFVYRKLSPPISHLFIKTAIFI